MYFHKQTDSVYENYQALQGQSEIGFHDRFEYTLEEFISSLFMANTNESQKGKDGFKKPAIDSSQPQKTNNINNRFAERMSKFLQEQKNKGKVFSSEDEIMSVFLDYLEASRKSEDKKYLELLLSYTHKSTINDITFNDLRDLSIFEDSKVEKGISNYITESISKENVKILVDLQTQRFRDALPSSDRKKRNDVLKDKGLSGEKIEKLISKKVDLLALLQKVFADFLESYSVERKDEILTAVAGSPVSIGDILKGFKGKHKVDIGNVHIKSLITDSEKDGLHKRKGAKELAGDMFKLINTMLIHEGVDVFTEGKETAKQIGNVFSHHRLTTGIFNNFPYKTFLATHPALQEKENQLLKDVDPLDEKARQIANDALQKEIRTAYLHWVVERIDQSTPTSSDLYPKQIAGLILQLEESDIADKKQLKKQVQERIQQYIRDEFIRQHLLTTESKKVLGMFGIENEKNLQAYLKFLEDFYNPNCKQAVFNYTRPDGSVYPITMTFTGEKQFVLNEGALANVTRYDQLFSFRYTIDLQSSDDIFLSLLANTNKHKLNIPDTHSSDKLNIFDKTQRISIYDNETKQVIQGFPVVDQKESGADEDINNLNPILTLHSEHPNAHGEKDQMVEIPLTLKGTLDVSRYEVMNQETTITVDLHPSDERTALGVKVSDDEDVFTHINWAILAKAKKLKDLKDAENQVSIAKISRPRTTEVQSDIDFSAPGEGKQPELSNFGGEKSGDLVDAPGEGAADSSHSPEEEALLERFRSYKFVGANTCPPRLVKNGKTPNARIIKGEIFFNKDYFIEKYKLKSIERETPNEKNNVPPTWLFDGETLFALRNKKDRKDTVPKVIQELRQIYRHEIAHRLFEFHGIQDTVRDGKGEIIDLPEGQQGILVADNDSQEIRLTQELLCQIADGQVPALVDEDTKRKYVTISDHKIRLDELEKEIGEQGNISGFSFKALKRLDAQYLEEYIQKVSNFDDLEAANEASLMANAGANTDLMPGTSSSESSNSHTNILQRNQRYLERVEENINELLDEWGTMPPHQKEKMTQKLNELSQLQEKLQVVAKKATNNTTLSKRDIAEALPLHDKAMQMLSNKKATTLSKEESSQKGIDQTLDKKYNEQSTPPETKETSKELIDFDSLFAEAFKKGDSDATATPGTLLFLKDASSSLPGGGNNRLQLRITEPTTDRQITFEVVDATERNASHLKGKKYTMPKNKETIDDLKRMGKNDLYKFHGSFNSQQGFFKHIQSLPEMPDGRDKIGGLKKDYFENGKQKNGPITHVGEIRQQIAGEHVPNDIYSVNWSENAVTIRTEVDEDEYFETTMDYSSFLIFCKDKGLKPLTQSEIDSATTNINPKKVKDKPFTRRDALVSIGTIVQAVKKFPEAFKQRREQDQKMQAAELYAKFANRLPRGIDGGLLYLDDIKSDALEEVDATVRQVIQEYKSKLGRGGDNGNDVHAKKATEVILQEIFEKPESGKRFRLKAAGYLLYALEAGSPYLRLLTPYANKDGGGYRIKMILGETHQKKFQEKRQKLIDYYKSTGGSSDNLQDEIVKCELEYLQGATTDHPFRGSKFGREIEIHMDKMYGGKTKVNPEMIAEKGNIRYMYRALRVGGENNYLPSLMMSSLKAMEGAIEEDSDYNLFYKTICMIFVSGYTTSLTKDYNDILKIIGRSRGIPIAMFAGHSDQANKVISILDYIGKKAGGGSLLTEIQNVIPGFDPKKVDISNFAKLKNGKPQFQVIMKIFDKRWDRNGNIAMGAFNYQNNNLVGFIKDKTIDPETKDTIQDYFGEGAMFGGYKGVKDNPQFDSDGQSKFFKYGIFNLSKGSFRGYMRTNKFNSAGKLNSDHIISMRESFSGIINTFGGTLHAASGPERGFMVKLLYNKFLQYFGEDLKKDSKDALKKALQEGNITKIREIIDIDLLAIKTRTDNKGEQQILREGKTEGVVQDTLHTYGDLLAKAIKDIPEGERSGVIQEIE